MRFLPLCLYQLGSHTIGVTWQEQLQQEMQLKAHLKVLEAAFAARKEDLQITQNSVSDLGMIVWAGCLDRFCCSPHSVRVCDNNT